MKNPLKNLFNPKLKLVKGTRFASFMFIALSIMIGGGILFAANMYYNIDTGEVILEEIQRVTGTLRATASLIVGGSDSQDPPSGVSLEVASGDVLLSEASQVLRFSGGTSYYVGLQAPTGITSTVTYILPDHSADPPGADYLLSWQSGNQLTWKDSGDMGLGTITAVGDVTTGAAFTSDGTQGTSLWFYQSSPEHRLQLTRATLSANRTITLPDADGTVALGTGTNNYVAYWSGTNTLAAEQYLATTRGGTGANTSGWNGMVQVVGGSWGTVTGTQNYVAYWSDANTIAAEQYLDVSRGGTGRGSWTQWGVLYADTTGSLANTAQGTADYILVGAGSSAPTWKTISDLLTAGDNISLTGTTDVTIATVMNPTFTTSVTSPQFLSTTTLALASGDGQDITLDSSSGRILLASGNWIETDSGYQIGKADTEILREMIPIMGFDLPVQTATTSYVSISRVIEDYPFATTSTGTTRVHKLVFRYSASTTAAIPFRVYTSSEYSSSTLPIPASTDLDKGEAYITEVTIPQDSTSWNLDIKTVSESDTVRIYQIFLSSYDKII